MQPSVTDNAFCHPEVFQRYVRLDEKSAGNGLGLAIVRDVAAAHGAGIALADANGGAGLLISVRFGADAQSVHTA